MTSVLIGGQGVADSTARRQGVVGGAGGWNSGTATNFDQLVTSAGTLQNLRVLLTVAPGSGKSYTVTLYKNGSSTALTVTVSDLATTGSDTTHTVSVAAGDKLRIEYTTSGTPTSTQMNTSVEYVGGTTDESQIMGCTGSTFIAGSGADEFVGVSGENVVSSADSISRQLIGTAGTIKNLYINADSVVSAGSIIFTLMVNGVASALTCTMNVASSTANDTTHTVAVAAGDTLSLRIDYTGLTGVSVINYGTTFLASTANEFPIIGGTSGDPSTSATNYNSLVASNNRTFVTTENQRQAVGSVWYVKNLYTKVSTAPGAAKSWKVTFRKGAADTALVNTISGAGTTTANFASTITLALYDAIDLSFTPAGTPSSSGEFYWGLTGTFVQPVVATSASTFLMMGV